MTVSQYPPIPSNYKDWKDWAVSLTAYLGGGAAVKQQLQPAPVLLSHRIGGGNLGAERPLVSGILMFNPSTGRIEFANGSDWIELADHTNGEFVLISGDTMTGDLILPGVPADDNGAVPKSFVGVEEFLETETYAFDDLVAYQGAVWHNINPLGSTGTFTLTDWRHIASDRMRWVGNWVNGNSYDQYDVSLDSPYLMIANKTTTDRPAPVTSGDPYYFYSGTSPVGSIVAKSLTVGQTYTTDVAGYVTGYRIYTTAGDDYTAYYSADGGAVITLISFTAATTGWVELPTNGTLVPAGTVLEVAVVMTEPDPTPTTFSGDWDYSTPNNDTVPGAGDITQSTKTLGSLRVSKTDNNAGDRSAELANMTAGDIIEGGGVRWAVLAVTDNGTWIDFTVAPAQQGAPVGVQTFTFETVTATPISGVLDTNYWLANPDIAGFYSVDGGARVNTQSQYSIDLQVQGVSASEDWDFLAVSGSGGSGGGSTNGPTVLSGEATIASGTQVVSFPTPFTQPPIVTATTKGIAGQSDTVVIATIGAITTTNFQVKLTQVDSAFSTPVKDVGGTINWIATGA